MFPPIRILAVTVIACGSLFLAGPAHATDRSGKVAARAVRKLHSIRHQLRPAEAVPSPEEEAAPKASKPEAEKPAKPQGKPSEKESIPDEDEEVSPGESPASCEGCELAGVLLGGSLWGMFGVARRRGVPRTVIRGYQPR